MQLRNSATSQLKKSIKINICPKEKRCPPLLCKSSINTEIEVLLKLTPERKKSKI